MIGSVVFHVGAFFVMQHLDTAAKPTTMLEFEIAELPELEPEPEPTPEVEPEVEPEPKVEPKPRPTRRPERAAPMPETPQQQTPPTEVSPKRFTLRPDQVAHGSGAGVSVRVGSGGGIPGGTAEVTHQSTGTGTRTKGSARRASGPTWQPRSDIQIQRLPDPIAVPKIECPAVLEAGISGTVVLEVQVTRSGTVRKVNVVRGIGHGCDRVAAKALRMARFRPAVATDGKSADYELRYEYVFALEG